MTTARNVALAGFLCFASALAFANSIAITGSADYGFAQSSGNFQIQGPGLSLIHVTLDGPSEIGECFVGKSCTVFFAVADASSFCNLCLGFDDGTVGGKVAESFTQNLTFTGSGIYWGGSSFTMHMTVSGTITGYELINCNDGEQCTLGPKEFTVHIVAQGVGTLTMTPDGSFGGIQGANVNFSGTASVATVPEPVSLVLTGTGLVGVWITKKRAQAKQA